ncbi:carboxyphosphonoenolpyruvate phosphonomutase-like protein [Lineolata rhizophorae]|uniref:Carboxyphosphonoenolpyruvate phosphonomutase-like protein n=1 Tax=Lineolata rhizophorae TaxID=578093 RepID=A0A6A6NKU5_9PEZI|nr:carboxyphosphonoenolpyruvate phosphonomutase-like protein [Lineolata rhizophorae]
MERSAQDGLARKLRDLHVSGEPLVICNVYDAATASAVCSLPQVAAIGTASYAIAATQGIEDDDMTLEQNMVSIKNVAAAVAKTPLPLTADLQDGYRDVKETVRRAIELGAVGCNIEDVDNATHELRPLEDAVNRVKLAIEAAAEAGVPNFAVNARSDALPMGGTIEDTITRGRAYLDAGANTVFVWGGGGGRGVSRDEVTKLVQAFDGRLNVKLKMGPGSLTVNELKEMGVARISVGPELFQVAMTAFKEAAAGLLGGQ